MEGTMDDPGPRIRELLLRARDLEQEAESLRYRARELLRTEIAQDLQVPGERTSLIQCRGTPGTRA